MNTYKVTITGQQKHIKGNLWNNQKIESINNMLSSYWDNDYPKPKLDGNSYELNGDQYITIEKE